MFENFNFTLNWLGIFLQIAGVAIGAYVFTQIKYREGPFDPMFFDPAYFDTGDNISELPKHPQTKKPIFPLIYNRKTAAVSVTSLIAGLTLQLIALNYKP